MVPKGRAVVFRSDDPRPSKRPGPRIGIVVGKRDEMLLIRARHGMWRWAKAIAVAPELVARDATDRERAVGHVIAAVPARMGAIASVQRDET